jgi:hypothetical protein
MIRAVIGGVADPVGIGRDEAGRRAFEELLKPQYQHESLPDHFLRVVQQFLGDLFDAVGGNGHNVIALIGLVAIVAGLVALLVWRARKATRAGRPAGEAVFGAEARTAAEHRDAAARLAAEGRWAEAIRERLRAIARDLEERAIVDAMPGRTARELSATAGQELPAFAADLFAAADLFDDVTYGEAGGSPEEYATLSRLDERLRTATRNGERAGERDHARSSGTAVPR